MSIDTQQLAQMVVDSCYYYDHRWAEHVCRYCTRMRGQEHAEGCEIHEVQAIANGEVMCCKGA